MFDKMFSSFFIIISIFAIGSCSNHFREAEKKILDSVLGKGNYDSRIRPPGANGTGPATVRHNFYIRSISRLDDVSMEYTTQITFRQQWNDNRLVYDDQGGNIRYLTLTDPSRVWKPDIFFSNEKESHFHDMLMPNVLMRIYPNGDILYSIRITLVLACPMDLLYYPFDKQTCVIKIASYGYTTDDLVLLWKESNPVQVTKELILPRFTLTKFRTDICTSRTNTGEYSCIVARLVFQRETSYYINQVFCPCIVLVIVSWAAFWLEPKAIIARIFIGITSLIFLMMMVSGINASLPPVSYTMAIHLFTGTCVTFSLVAFLQTILAHRLFIRQNRHDPSRKWMRATNLDRISRIGFPVVFGVYVFVYFVRYSYFRGDNDD